MTDILDLIDRAVADCLSPDAMRWGPDLKDKDDRYARFLDAVLPRGFVLTYWQRDLLARLYTSPTRRAEIVPRATLACVSARSTFQILRAYNIPAVMISTPDQVRTHVGQYKAGPPPLPVDGSALRRRLKSRRRRS